KACVLPENPASYRVVRTKSYLFNKAALFPKLMNKLTAYRHGVSGYQDLFRAYGFGSSVEVGATLPDPATQAPIAKFFECLNKTVNKQGIYPLTFENRGVNGSSINNFIVNQWPGVV
ncbi:hypothetical protein, partial [Klebsiella oxytoca]|uniref:hypothetical protein n=1 Tax=Klebsiella oxytoca TaxID=571 RepID=UPI003A974018